MFVLIDKDRMVVVCRHPNRNILSHLENIQFAHITSLMFEEEDCIHCLETVEMLRLYTSLTGAVFPGFNREVLAAKLVTLLHRIVPADVNPLLAIAQSNCIPFSDKGFYKYDPVACKPIRLKQEVVPIALLPGDAEIVSTAPARFSIPVVKPQQIGGETKYPPPWK